MKDHYPRGYHMAKEVLTRQVGEAQRWSVVMEAVTSLMHVRRMGASMEEESRHLSGDHGPSETP